MITGTFFAGVLGFAMPGLAPAPILSK